MSSSSQVQYLLRRIIPSITFLCIYLIFLLIRVYFFELLKTSKVIVIYKKNNRCDYSTYRPISITSHELRIKIG